MQRCLENYKTLGHVGMNQSGLVSHAGWVVPLSQHVCYGHRGQVLGAVA